MTEKRQIYKCNICGNIVEVIHEGAGALVCCGEPMALLDEKTKDSGSEKHAPVIEKISGGIRVNVGSVPHPMDDTHFIEWIELVCDGVVYRKFLKAGDAPEADFECGAQVEDAVAREYCSMHGLWKS
ncbi:MAG: desulfoferrodoxin [Candidatus Nanohalarchaeota archaeon]|nr:MAG: desulfoferrodoxin [Candidatus Nanohaloarchaeota archaeon]